MYTLTTSVRSTLAVVLLVCLALAWGLAVPDALSPVSYMLFAGLFTALAAVALITYKNAQATGSVAQLLYEAETSASPAAQGVRRPASQARPQA